MTNKNEAGPRTEMICRVALAIALVTLIVLTVLTFTGNP